MRKGEPELAAHKDGERSPVLNRQFSLDALHNRSTAHSSIRPTTILPDLTFSTLSVNHRVMTLRLSVIIALAQSRFSGQSQRGSPGSPLYLLLNSSISFENTGFVISHLWHLWLQTSITQLALCKFLTFFLDCDSSLGSPAGREQPLVFSGSLTLLSLSLVFSLLSGGKCDKVAFSFLASMFDCLCSQPVGLLLLWGGGFGHRGDCFTWGYRKVRSKINEETALLL